MKIANIFNWRAILVTLALVVASCTVDSELEYSEPTTEDVGEATGIIEWMHENLLDKYLYNSEYAAISPKDFTKEYDEYLSYHLLQLDYNFDKHKYPDSYGGGDYIFSYIERESTSSSLATRSSSETNTSGYGVVAMSPFIVTSTNYSIVITIDAIYNDSPADTAGLKRGDIITKFNGAKITTSNYSTVLYTLYYYIAGGDITLTLSDNRTVDLSPASFSSNPVIGSQIYTVNSDKKVGYLNYVSFDNSFDTELETAVGDLGSVDDLILDIRLNLGGYVTSANTLTALVSNNKNSNQVFQHYRFNDDYMGSSKWGHGLSYSSSMDLYYEKLYTSSSDFSLSSGGTIYCLVSYETASASEMVINSLKGMGYNVVLIGDTTRGKNSGMYGFSKTIDNYKYTLWAINFQNLNCLGEGDYANGFTPDYEIDEYGEWIDRQSKYSAFSDFSKDEILIKTALDMSAGTYQATSTTRTTDSYTPLEKLPTPTPKGAISGSRKLATE